MKKIFIMLLIAITAVTTTSAQQRAQQRKQQDNTPNNVIKTFDFICEHYGLNNSLEYSLKKNPNTGIIESKEVIVPFVCKKSEPCIAMVANCFQIDERVSYQISHITKGNRNRFSIKVLTSNEPAKTVVTRTSNNQEMWYMAVKNPDNPQLRDVYAIVWEDMDAENVKGKIFMITSLRPDLFEKEMEKEANNTFKIEGRVDAEIKDSLYNVYIADTYEELNALDEDDYIACVPVVNKRFEYSVQLDKPKAGRIRCIFPDGSLCSAWIDIDMVPGETYHMTVHNGYYDGDDNYENRVGRYSGKSLVAGHEYDDVVIADTVGTCEWQEAERGQFNSNAYLTEAQQKEIQNKGKAIDANKKYIELLYSSVSEYMERQPTKQNSWDNNPFKMISKQNAILDKQIDDILKTLADYGLSRVQIVLPNETNKTVLLDLFRYHATVDILNFFTLQNQAFNELYKKYGDISKDATKCQKQVHKLTEKYLKMTQKKSY